MSEPKIKTLVLDVLKPHSPPLPEFARFVSELEGVKKVDNRCTINDFKRE